MKYKEIIEIILLALIVFWISIIVSNMFWFNDRLNKIDTKVTNVQETLDSWFTIYAK